MSVLSDIWDVGKTFIQDNKDWLKPVVQLGVGALGQKNTDNAQSEYLKYLKGQEDQNYQNYVDAATAANANMASNASASAASRASSAAAARATEAARMAASKKANRYQQNMYKKLIQMYSPYKDVADRLLPQMTDTYEGSLGLMDTMKNFVSSPEQMKNLNGSVPSWMVNVPLPERMRGK